MINYRPPLRSGLVERMSHQVSTLKGLDSHYGTKGLRKVAAHLNGRESYENCAGDCWLSQWREGDLPVQLCSGQQQWHVSGGRPDSRDYLLYLSLPLIIHMARVIGKEHRWCDKVLWPAGVISEDATSSTRVSQWWQFRINIFHCMWSSAVWCKPMSEI